MTSHSWHRDISLVTRVPSALTPPQKVFTYPQIMNAELFNINVHPQNINTYAQTMNDERLSINTYP